MDFISLIIPAILILFIGRCHHADRIRRRQARGWG